VGVPLPLASRWATPKSNPLAEVSAGYQASIPLWLTPCPAPLPLPDNTANSLCTPAQLTAAAPAVDSETCFAVRCQHGGLQPR
jgi:hypothetical protein